MCHVTCHVTPSNEKLQRFRKNRSGTSTFFFDSWIEIYLLREKVSVLKCAFLRFGVSFFNDNCVSKPPRGSRFIKQRWTDKANLKRFDATLLLKFLEKMQFYRANAQNVTLQILLNSLYHISWDLIPRKSERTILCSLLYTRSTWYISRLSRTLTMITCLVSIFAICNVSLEN